MSDTVYTDIYELFGKTRVDNLANDEGYSGANITSGSLIKGTRYTWTDAGTGADFSNITDTTVAVGSYFYATATAAPTAWGSAVVYEAMSPSDIITKAIADAVIKFQAIADACDQTFSQHTYNCWHHFQYKPDV